MKKVLDLLKKIPGSVIGFLVVFGVFAIFGNKFLTAYNLLNILRNSSVLMVVATGMTMALLLGKNDMSIGSLMSLSGILICIFLGKGMSFFVAALLTILICACCGAVTGSLIAYLKADYWIAAFSMMSLASGMALVLSNGRTLTVDNAFFKVLGSGKFLGVYNLVYVGLIIVLVMLFVLKKTKFGYDIYAYGNSETCAKLSGMNTEWICLRVYILNGILAGIAGIMLAAKTYSGLPGAGTGYEFDSIASALIGGTTFAGGTGGLSGTILGALLIMTIRNGLTMIGVPTLWQFVCIGTIIMIVIIGDVTRHNAKVARESMRRYSND